MLHTPSYNIGLAAGTAVKGAGIARPNTLDEIPGLIEILDKSESLKMFFPSSYVEGFLNAWDNPSFKMIEWPD